LKLADKHDKGKSGIYIITNKINNKVYIGQSIDLWTRINEGYLQKLPKNKGHNRHLQRAWNKYGEESFTFEIIEYVDDYEKLNERETYWMHKYKSYDKIFGYNIDPIGGSKRGTKVSEEQKRKQSIAISGKNNGMYGKTHSDEVKLKLAEAHAVPIIQLDKKGNFIREWKSVKDAADSVNGARAPITSVLRKKTATSHGFVWVYKDEYDKGDFDIKEHLAMHNIKRSVVQLSLIGEKINEFSSIAQATKETGATNITVVCQGEKNISGGYAWMYKEDYERYGFDEKKYKKLRENNQTKRIIQLTSTGEFVASWENAKIAANTLDCSWSTIVECCRGKNKKALGYIWLFENEYLENGIPKDRLNIKRKPNQNIRKVVQLTLKGEYINQFSSPKEASIQTGILAQNIGACCRKVKGHKTAGGFKWIYLDDFIHNK
jgi:group I intron endonuclease